MTDCCSVQLIAVGCVCKWLQSNQRLAACTAFPSIDRKGCSTIKLLTICENALASSLLLCYRNWIPGQTAVLFCQSSQVLWPFLAYRFCLLDGFDLGTLLTAAFIDQSTAALTALLRPLRASSVVAVIYTIAHGGFLSVLSRTASKIAWSRLPERSAEAPLLLGTDFWRKLYAGPSWADSAARPKLSASHVPINR